LYSSLVIELRSEIQFLKDTNSKQKSENFSEIDSSYYVKKYPDVLKSGMTPKQHYQRYGKLLGRTLLPE
ncbi:hypothetical protein, partial [Endozoicomonas arenosclerae]|uniref:hypothetical protein n=1 Tax=Endozoicomonas arenosclerae TaxID=1633495 RepID=UPI000A490AA5